MNNRHALGSFAIGLSRASSRGEEAIGRDRVYAGPGNDVVTVLENWGWYMPFIDCGAGHDTVVVPIRMGALTQNCERDVVKAR